MLEAEGFKPDWFSPPGDTMGHILAERSLSPQQFADRLKKPLTEVQELLNGDAELTAELAKRLSVVLGASEQFWLTREAQFRQDASRLRRMAKMEAEAGWLAEMPVADMMEWGWIPRAQTAEARAYSCLRFFGVPDATAWRENYINVLPQTAVYRTSKSFSSDAGAVAAWLRQGELEASTINCAAWDPPSFRNALGDIRVLTRLRDPQAFIPKLREICAACGVAVAVVRAPSKCRASGATRFITATRPLLLLSMRHLSDDHFWFTFFHETGHLLLHGGSAIFVDLEKDSSTKEEEEANRFAESILIPANHRATFLRLSANGREVIRFARSIGVSPGIVVGQLQHHGRLGRHQLNNLKTRFLWE